MTVDTSRPAVEALIAEHEMLWARGAYINVSLANQIEQTLAALLDERDEYQTRFRNQMDGAMEQVARISDLEAQHRTLVELREQAQQRIRHLEATNRKISERSANHHDNAIKWRERAERAQAKLDAVKALCEKESGEIRTRYEPEGPYTGYANACDDMLAILADTNEGSSK